MTMNRLQRRQRKICKGFINLHKEKFTCNYGQLMAGEFGEVHGAGDEVFIVVTPEKSADGKYHNYFFEPAEPKQRGGQPLTDDSERRVKVDVRLPKWIKDNLKERDESITDNNATRHLTRLERSLYRDLLDLYFDKESAIKNDLEYIFKRTLAHTDEEKQAVKDILLEFFFLDENGAWRNERCDAVIVEYQKGQNQKAKNKEAQNARKEKSREKRKGLFAQLNELGITPKWNSTIAELESELSRVTGHESHAPSTVKPEPKPEPEPEKQCAAKPHNESDEEKKKNRQKILEESELEHYFETFWFSGIRKDNKKKAKPLFKKILKSKPFYEWDNFTKSLVLDIEKRIEVEQLGFDKMLPTTYLNGERWNDSIVEKTVEEKLLKLPADNEKLWQFAKDHGLPEPYSGEDFFTYRARLNTHIQENQVFAK